MLAGFSRIVPALAGLGRAELGGARGRCRASWVRVLRARWVGPMRGRAGPL
jgi:hypothetical protein